MKTLLLSALVPDVDPLRALDAGRLAALNHGQITSPIPGQERQLVIQKVRQWAAQVGEIKVSEDPVNPTISLELVAVDVESILRRARHFDTPGSRRTLVRDMVLGEFGVAESGELTLRHEFVWRGSKRELELVFGNIRDPHEIPDATLRSHGDTWKLVVDFPFDEEGHSPADDRARIESYEAHALTVCWLPNFLTREMQAQLGTLVVLDSLLTGERLQQYADHLSVVDREAARPLLENRRSMLKEQLRVAIAQAYAASTPDSRNVDAASHRLISSVSLDRSFQPVPPPGPTLGAALENLRDQMLAHQYPEHPHFPELVKPADLRKVRDEVRRAIEENGRIEVDRPLRAPMRQIAQPLRLGEMHEVPFVLGQHWIEHFHRLRAAARERGEGDELDGRPASALDGRAATDGPAAAGSEPRDPHLRGSDEPQLLLRRHRVPRLAGEPAGRRRAARCRPAAGRAVEGGCHARRQDLRDHCEPAGQCEQRRVARERDSGADAGEVARVLGSRQPPRRPSATSRYRG